MAVPSFGTKCQSQKTFVIYVGHLDKNSHQFWMTMSIILFLWVKYNFIIDF